MKIVHAFHNYWPVFGGLEKAIKSVAEKLAELNNEVHVITSVLGAEDRPKEEAIGGVYVHRVKALKSQKSLLRSSKIFAICNDQHHKGEINL